MRFRHLAPLAFALCSMVASAQLYSWKDASGKTHYSDTPPDKTATRRVAPPATGAGDPAVRRNAVDQEAAARKQQKDAQEAAGKAEKDKADADERHAQCERARASLQALESGQVRFTIDSKGERVALDGSVREAELARARKAADSWCN